MLPVPFENIKIRASEVIPGDWYLPLERAADPYEKVEEALSRGALGFSFEPPRLDPALFPNAQLQPTNSLLDLLFQVTAEKRDHCTGLFAAITGSAGKSTVKEMVGAIAAAWASSDPARGYHASPEYENSRLSLCAQILALPRPTPVAVFAVGARCLGDYAIPMHVIAPHVVALLNIGRARLGEFGSLSSLQEAKLSALAAPSAEVLVVPNDNPMICTFALARGKRVHTFGTSPAADTSAMLAGNGRVEIESDGERISLARALSAPGYLENVAAACAVARKLGLPMSAVKSGLDNFAGMPSRFERRLWRNKVIVDDAFNTSPETMLAGLRSFLEGNRGMRLAVALGSVLGLGSHSSSIHRELGESLSQLMSGLDHPLLLVTVGDDAALLGESIAGSVRDRVKLQSFSQAIYAETFLKHESPNWDAVYLKGSRTMGLRGLLRDGVA